MLEDRLELLKKVIDKQARVMQEERIKYMELRNNLLLNKQMNMIEIKVVNEGKQKLPEYSTPQSAGLDLRADIEEPIVLKPFERRLVSTGLKLALPDGYELQVRPRSGLALKHGITVLNTPGTVDADYRGVVGVILINLSDEDFTIEPGDRIAQVVVAKYEQIKFNVVEALDETERGEGGFGHSKIK